MEEGERPEGSNYDFFLAWLLYLRHCTTSNLGHSWLHQAYSHAASRWILERFTRYLTVPSCHPRSDFWHALFSHERYQHISDELILSHLGWAMHLMVKADLFSFRSARAVGWKEDSYGGGFLLALMVIGNPSHQFDGQLATGELGWCIRCSFISSPVFMPKKNLKSKLLPSGFSSYLYNFSTVESLHCITLQCTVTYKIYPVQVSPVAYNRAALARIVIHSSLNARQVQKR